MKLKKFFAGVLAAAMMLTVGATAAFATGSTITLDCKEYSDAQTVTVKKVYKLEGNGSNAKETFTLAQVGNGVVKSGDATSAPELGTITGATFEAGTATAEGVTGNITIALLSTRKLACMSTL